MNRKQSINLAIYFALSVMVIFSIYPATAYAASGSEFNPGYIVSDFIFTNNTSMGVADIQNFFNQKNSVCLKDYNGTGYAASVIKQNADTFGINPKVILVTLQKETGLITTKDCASWRYRTAMGYGCPDSTPGVCDSSYYGFNNQVYQASRMFRKIMSNDPNWYTPYLPGLNTIKWHPNSGCGTSQVNILNRATAALYSYTPYRPNATALSNVYGSQTDGCSSYGNRNFWRDYTDWFGSTITNCIYPYVNQGEVFRLVDKNTNNYLLTSNPDEICKASGLYGYLYDGLFSNSIDGGSPVYRLKKGSNYLFTISSQEKDQAISQHGYSLEGIAFMASTIQTSEANMAVYRLRYPSTGAYMFTVSQAEKDMFVASYGFTFEGVAYYTKNFGGATQTDSHRLSHPVGGLLFTGSTNEVDVAEGSGYQYNGISFKATTNFYFDTLPVYRLRGPHGYILTTDLNERKLAIQYHGFRDEGLAFFAYQASSSLGTKPVYRLSTNRGTYLYTTSATERDQAVSSYAFRLEGTGFRVP